MANLSLRVDDETKHRLDTLVSSLGINASAVIRKAIDSVLKELSDGGRLDRDLELSLKDRLILHNQSKILAKLYPEESEDYERHASIFQKGYAFCYPWVTGHFYDETSTKDCNEVLEILDMYRALNFSYQDLADKDGIKEEDIAFGGFDGNHESEQIGFATFILEDEEKYKELKKSRGFAYNSHFPSLQLHRSRVSRWHGEGRSGRSSKLNAAQIRKIIDAPKEPE